jgi:ribosomal protein S18 acetylase RimI-like enzyme
MLPPHDRARRIEEAALRAWPAHADSDFDGWRLRFADGYTRRANSITPLGPSRLALDDKIATCERLYAERGLPVIFRLTPFAPPDLDPLLARRGYRLAAQVEVRARSLASPLALPPARTPGIFRAHPIDRWLDIFGMLSGAPAANRPAHRAVLNVVPGIRRLWVLWANGQAAACGMSVFSDGLMGIFDLVTAAEQRKLGYGSEIVRRTLLWGARAGAHEAYLQVLGRNDAARRLYDRAGFEVVYQYHYRERP